MFKVTVKDGSQLTVEDSKTLFDLAGDISGGLQRAALAAEVNGTVTELTRTIQADATVSFLTFDDQKGKDTFRHTASHILAQAVKRLYPQAKLAIGPAIENGFYYDFDCDVSFTAEVLTKLEEEMQKIACIQIDGIAYTLSSYGISDEDFENLIISILK